MGWAPNYAALSDLKAAVHITDTDDDAELMYALTAASRAVDNHTGRQFGKADTAVARYYSGYWDLERGRWSARIDDLMDLTDLVVKTDAGDETFSTTLAISTDFRLAPYNAAADEMPWTTLVAVSGGTFPTYPRTIEITAFWGWTNVPDVVLQATLLQAARIFKRKDAPFGVTGSPELGSEVRLLERVDPDVAVLLSGLGRRRLI
jgi:hypothetical protein